MTCKQIHNNIEIKLEEGNSTINLISFLQTVEIVVARNRKKIKIINCLIMKTGFSFISSYEHAT